MGLFGEKCLECGSRTRKKDKLGQPKCEECQKEEGIKERMDSEKIVKCPIDGEHMEKESIEDIIIDRCPRCGGVWLDKEEMERLKEYIEEGTDGGIGFATGLALGTAIK